MLLSESQAWSAAAVHTFNSSTLAETTIHLCEASLVFIGRPRTARATLSQKTKKQKERHLVASVYNLRTWEVDSGNFKVYLLYSPQPQKRIERGWKGAEMRL